VSMEECNRVVVNLVYLLKIARMGTVRNEAGSTSLLGRKLGS